MFRCCMNNTPDLLCSMLCAGADLQLEWVLNPSQEEGAPGASLAPGGVNTPAAQEDQG